MKVVIPGGSGQVGTVLARHLTTHGHEVVVLSRRPDPAAWRVVPWDARSPGPWEAELDGADAVVNLAGRSVNCRYTKANRRAILDSRVESTRAVGAAIARAARPPRVWLQMATATIYAHRSDAPNDEATGQLGGSEPHAPNTWRFSTEVATMWERACDEAATPGTRKVLLRTAMVMTPDPGGVFDVLLRLVRWWLGGSAGSGRQFVSWVHGQDFVRAIDWLIARDDLSGPVNVAAPSPVPNAEFMRVLRRAWGARFGLPAAGWMVGLGAWVMRTESELVLKSRRVIPGRLLESGFTFDFPDWAVAAADLVRGWRDLRTGR